MQLREVTLNDLDTIQWWHDQSHLVDRGPGHDYDWVEQLRNKVDWRQQYIAEYGGKAIAFVQIYDPYEEDEGIWDIVTPKLRVINVWIGEAGNLNKGLGTLIMQLAIKRAFEDPNVYALLVDPLISNKKAQRFYARLGFKFLESRNVNGERCYVFRMRRDQYESWFK